jgi:hypothetical protein
MSDSNLTEKISEAITNTFKKTKIFEKFGKIEFYVGSFIVISSIISLTNIYVNYCNANNIKKLEDKIDWNKFILKFNIEMNRKQNALYYNKIIKQARNDTALSIETQHKIIEKIMEIEILLQNSKKEAILTSTSASDHLPIKSIDSIDGWGEDIIKQEDVNEMEDNELLNECYDSIPLNNLKKNISSWLI